MTESKKCPKCKRICLASEKECVCGYNFESGDVAPEAKRISRLKKIYIITTIAVVIVYGIVAAILDLRNPAILLAALLAAEGIIFGTIRKKRGKKP